MSLQDGNYMNSVLLAVLRGQKPPPTTVLLAGVRAFSTAKSKAVGVIQYSQKYS